MDVRLPDGTIIQNVPEGTTQRDLMARVGQATPEVAEKQGWGEYLAEGAKSFAKGAVLSPYLAGEQIMGKVGQALSVGPKSLARETQRYEEATSRAKAEEQAGGIPYMAGQAVPALLAGPAGVARAAAVGAGTSLMTPATGEGDFARQKASQAAWGAGGGAAGGAIGKVISPGASTRAAQDLIDQGIPLTPGQSGGKAAHAIETFASKSPVVGGPVRTKQMKAVEGYNRAEYNRVLSPIGAKVGKEVEVGHPGVQAVEKVVQQKYDEIVPKLTVAVDQGLADGWEKIATKAAGWQGAEGKKAKDFLEYLMQETAARVGNTQAIPGKVFQEIRSDLKGRIGELPKEGYYAKDLRQAVQGIIKELDAAAKRSNPALAGELDKIDQAYARLVVLRRAASKDTSIEGVFSPKEMRKASIKGYPESSVARGRVPGQTEAEQAGKFIKRPSSTESQYPNFLLGVPRAIAGGAAAAPTLLPRTTKAIGGAARIGGVVAGQRQAE